MKMKNKYILVATLAAIVVISVAFLPGVLAVKDETGNGAPSGPHYNLNIIGVTNPKNFDIKEAGHDNGHRIFVKLNKDGSKATTRINLVEGDEFKVIDPDGTDGSATLQLLNPYPDYPDASLEDVDVDDSIYRIYLRALGKPGGKVVITSGFNDTVSDWLSLENVTLTRNNGKTRFEDRTLELTTVYVDYDDDGLLDRLPIFGNDLWDYFWNYDNEGMKHIQMRIYLV